MDSETRQAFQELLAAALAPVQAQLARLNGVLLEGDDELGIPSMVRRLQRVDERIAELEAKHAARIRRLELAIATAALVSVVAVALASDSGLAGALANLIRLVGLK